MERSQTSLTDFASSEISLTEELVREIEQYRQLEGGQAALFDHEDPPPPRPYLTYVLSIDPLPRDEARERCLQQFGFVRDWIIEAGAYQSVYYIGYTGRPYKRLEEHDSQDHRAAKFLQVHSVNHVHEFYWFDRWRDAKDKEVKLTDTWNTDPDVYVPYCDWD